jgi:hypothetical protein
VLDRAPRARQCQYDPRRTPRRRHEWPA